MMDVIVNEMMLLKITGTGVILCSTFQNFPRKKRRAAFKKEMDNRPKPKDENWLKRNCLTSSPSLLCVFQNKKQPFCEKKKSR